MFSGTKKDLPDDDCPDIKMWAFELMLQTFINTKFSKQDSNHSLEKEDIVKIIELSKMIHDYVSFDILPEGIDDFS